MPSDSPTVRIATSRPLGNPGHLSTTYVVNGSIAVDAGAVASMLSLDEQRAVRHVLLTHSHLDHVHELPQFLDNVQTARATAGSVEPVEIHAERATVNVLRRHLFTGLWPDVTDDQVGFARWHPFDVREAPQLTVGEFRVEPVRTVHRVPTVGFVLRREGLSIAIFADTGHRRGLLDGVAEDPDLKFLALEVSYPNRLESWARAHGHLTTSQLASLLAPFAGRATRPVVSIHHLKPAFAEEVVEELEALVDPELDVRIARDGERFAL